MENTEVPEELHCYCSTTELEPYMLTCFSCRKKFHSRCLVSGRPSNLIGDIYFEFCCLSCSSTGEEIVKRMKLQWTFVIMISLYNLQRQGGGKCGYFRWREHICQFIDKNWDTFFVDKKRSATFHGTIAGALSSNANKLFVSGMEVLGESGWWSLKPTSLPSLDELKDLAQSIKSTRKRKEPEEESSPIVEGCRRKTQNIVEAAVALKEKKSHVPKSEPKPKKKKCAGKTSPVVIKTEKLDNGYEDAIKNSVSRVILNKKNVKYSPSYYKPDFDMTLPDDIFDYESALGASDTMNIFDESYLEKTDIKQEVNSDEDIGGGKSVGHQDMSRKRKAITREENVVEEEAVVTEPKFTLMSPYEEEQLMLKLEANPLAMKEKCEIRRLYRKLVVRKLKRQNGIPVFDIDAEMRSLSGLEPIEISEKEATANMYSSQEVKITNILDRYQVGTASSQSKTPQHFSFIARLMGLEDSQLDNIVSPYTHRVLKPFIFRDYKTRPLKLKLLEELVIRANKNNPHFLPPKPNPIDFCYIRPYHIPAINALCHEFFWPGINTSECLQYPDFTCVAMYKKIVVGFAIMTPDVKFNEVYISFIFCHPEWRRCGIATFMLYHLIQTCMGKDVTLHVSATSDAVLLYQKFGFKIEEFIQDFYEKYFPLNSKECKHAVFMRLSR